MHPVNLNHGLFNRRNSLPLRDIGVVLMIADIFFILRKTRFLYFIVFILQIDLESFLDLNV